jgi:Tfp pilus assembly protein PilX
MRRLRRLFREEQGFALVIALGVTVVFGLMVVTVIESARSNSRSSTMSVGRMSAYNLAEAGINNAMSALRLTTNNHWTTTSSAR